MMGGQTRGCRAVQLMPKSTAGRSARYAAQSSGLVHLSNYSLQPVRATIPCQFWSMFA